MPVTNKKITENKGVVETKTDETIQEMNKIADKALNETVVEAKKAEEAEEAKKLEEAEEAKKTEEAEEAKKLEEAEEAKKLEEAEENSNEKLSEIKNIIKSENYFNYVSFGKFLNEELTEKEIKKFSVEFLKSGMLSTQNHYRLASLLKKFFPSK